MRVVHLCRGFPPFAFDGAAVANGGLCMGLAHSGVEVTVLSIESEAEWHGRALPIGEPTPNGADLQAGRSSGAMLQVLRVFEDEIDAGLERVDRGNKTNVLHFHEHMDLHAVRQLARRLEVPTVHSIHEIQLDHGGRSVKPADRRGQAAAAELADLVILPTQRSADRFEREYPETQPSLRIVPHGIDDTKSARWDVRKRRARQGRTVLYCGRLSRQKGTDVLLEAMTEVLGEVEDCRFVLVGLRDFPRQIELVSQWRGGLSSDRAQRVTVRAWIESGNLDDLYSEADVIVVPSRMEIFGLVVLEAALHGCGVVATRTDGPREILDEGRYGVLVPPGDSDALARATIRLLKNGDERLQLGRAAAASVRRRYDRIACTGRMIDVYRELAG